MSDTKLKIAVFIDFDNIEIGVKTTLNLQFDIGAVLEAIKERGEVVTKLAYGDWKRSGDHGRAMAQHAVRMVQRVMTPGGDKNGADINLALDALEMAFTHAHINAFVIVGGDSDFITLVEKLKQYDRKVFVVGGRAFTSQVMQKNCTEFMAYENIVPDALSAAPARAARDDRGGRHARHEKRDRTGVNGTTSIDQVLPLIRRALKVLSDREVSPQLGLLKSTLLQLDSSFSERDYGAGTFREFAEKLAKEGLVSLKHQGRSTLVELPGLEPLTPAEPPVVAEPSNLTELLEQPDSIPQEPAPQHTPSLSAQHTPSLSEGVALVRRALAEAAAPPRWPMYPRQFKQFLRNVQGDFDERKYGSIGDLMRACQKDGLLRLERDRQGGLRVFAGGTSSRASVPHGWGLGARDNGGLADGPNGSDRSEAVSDITDDIPRVVDVPPDAIVEEPPPVIDAQVTAIENDVPTASKAKRGRARKTAAKTSTTASTSRSARTSKKKTRE